MTPNQLAELRRDEQQLILATRGEFDNEIKRLQDAVKDWDTRYNLPALEQQLSIREKQVAKRESELMDERERAAKQMEEAATAHAERSAKLDEAWNEHRAAKEDLETSIVAFGKERTEFERLRSKQERELTERRRNLDVEKADLTDRAARLVEREARLKNAIAALGSA
jgi:chromosome segregation ATPase